MEIINEYAQKRLKITLPEIADDDFDRLRVLSLQVQQIQSKARKMRKRERKQFIAFITDMDIDFWKTGCNWEQDKVTHVLHRRIYKAFPVSGISKKFLQSYKSQLFHERCLLRLQLSQLKFHVFYYGPKPINND